MSNIKITDIKSNFKTEKAYRVYSPCMYLPTREKFDALADRLMKDGAIRIIGLFDESEPVGAAAYRLQGDDTAEIVGIAVLGSYRKRGAGRKMIYYIMENINVLYSETDDDAIEFYRHCGFETEEFFKIYNGQKFRRYKCVLRKNN